ncbi:MAG: ABC transporter permease [Alphaproteobacteria bacterium]
MTAQADTLQERARLAPLLWQAIRSAPPAIFVAAGVILAAFIFVPALMGLPFQMVILRQAAPIGLAICAQLLVLRSNSIDLSMGGLFILVNYLVTSSALSGYPTYVIVAAPLIAGCIVGAVNGFFVAVFRASSVVVTLAMGVILSGVVLYLSSGSPPGSAGDFVRQLGVEKWGPVPIAVVIWLVVAAILAISLRTLIYGRFIRVIGANPVAASISGIPVARMLFVSHMFSGFLASLGGLLMAGYIGMGSVKLGIDVVMMSIAGVILGGITFGGGKKGIFGAIVAAYALAFLFNLMTALRFGEPGKLIVQGAVIALASIVASLSANKEA